jgi:hypothetical protein
MTNYFVGRLQKDFNNRNSYIGGMFTAVNRKLEGTTLDFLHASAYAGGLDFKHNWNNRKYYVAANFVLSNVHGSETAITATQESLAHLFQRSDARHLSVDPTKIAYRNRRKARSGESQ